MLRSLARLVFLAPALTSVFVCALPDISVVVDGPSSVNNVQLFKVSSTITNHGDEVITLLNSSDSVLTPKWKTNAFSVVSQGSGLAARFAGVKPETYYLSSAKIKWSPELAVGSGDVTVIPAGKSITIDQNLGGVYDLSGIGEGPYEISANANFFALDASGSAHALRATKTKSHVTHISGEPTSVRRRALEKRAIGYNNCTDSQKAILTMAAKCKVLLFIAQ
ncbi:hypothetical protein FRB99_001860 [Tulasnella sp. 403]|nr:hypothetical protein FRB99_001860 [Tulasnella sp. 403]